MPRASATAENAALNGLDGSGSANTIRYVSLHNADPGTTGNAENDNSGGYGRQSCNWNVASGGVKTNSSALTFATGGTVPCTHFGTWNSGSYGGGNYSIGGALATTVTAVAITIAPGAISLSAT